MVSGLQSVEKGKIELRRGSSSSTRLGFTIPTGGAAILAADIKTVEAKGKVQQESKAGTSYGHADERIWAAQFMKLVPKFKKDFVEGDNPDLAAFKWVKLHVPIDV